MSTPRWKPWVTLALVVFTLAFKGPPHNPNRPHGCLFVGPDCQIVDPTVIEHPTGNR